MSELKGAKPVEKEHYSIATVLWKYKGLRLKTEYYTKSPDPIWITIVFDPPIQTKTILPDHFNQIDIYDPKVYDIVIQSKIDGYRLFVHGSGELCDAITLY